MQYNEFYEKLRDAALELITDFQTEDVKSVETNCGTTWIELKDGTVYYLTLQQCQPEPEMEQVFTQPEGA